MRFVVLAMTAALLMSGCGSSVLSIFKKDEIYERGLSHTKRAQIISSLETRAYITASRLKAIDPKTYHTGESFLVGVLISDDRQEANQSGLYNKSLSYHLNGLSPLTITPIDVEDPLVKRLPHTNAWSRYYLVSFPDINGSPVLSFSLESFGEANLSFEAGSGE
ncbi:MAG: hypothetical protein K6347_06440 [Campylobacterales bacterium]